MFSNDHDQIIYRILALKDHDHEVFCGIIRYLLIFKIARQKLRFERCEFSLHNSCNLQDFPHRVVVPGRGILFSKTGFEYFFVSNM
jgi:hypothetical protein